MHITCEGANTFIMSCAILHEATKLCLFFKLYISSQLPIAVQVGLCISTTLEGRI